MDREATVNAFAGVIGVRMQHLPYHNFEHAVSVSEAAERLARLEGYSEHDAFLFSLMGLGHDEVQGYGAPKNELLSAASSRVLALELGLSTRDADMICEGIVGTDIFSEPTSLVQQIMRDADLDHLGREDFMKYNDALAHEWGRTLDTHWYEETLAFMREHEYFTQSARELRTAGKEANIEMVRRKLVQLR